MPGKQIWDWRERETSRVLVPPNQDPAAFWEAGWQVVAFCFASEIPYVHDDNIPEGMKHGNELLYEIMGFFIPKWKTTDCIH